MSVNERPPGSARPSDASDTTTWGGAAAPAVIEDEDATVVSPIPDSDPDNTETLITPLPVDAPPSAPIAPSSSLRPLLLERIEPSLGRGERLRLDATHWNVSLGRAEESYVRLYTASASRDHATIAGNEKGEWVLTPAPNKSVLIDGESISEDIVLEVGTNIVLGQDHLRCVAEGLDRAASAAATVADGFKDPDGGGNRRVIVIGLVLGAATLIGIAWAFFALRGAASDGHKFIAAAVAKGARAIIVEEVLPLEGDVTRVIVDNSRQAMAFAAQTFHGDPTKKMTTVGITGTNGKTTITYLLEAILAQAGMAPAVIGTINYRFGRDQYEASHTTPEKASSILSSTGSANGAAPEDASLIPERS